MDSFEKKTVKVSRGYTYTYYVSRPSSSPATKAKLPALLFHHGWPDHAAMWCALATRLRDRHQIPNRIIIPDMLGYGGTSKPTSPVEYAYDGLTQDMVDLLDAESVDQVISVGHDWGSRAAQRLWNHHPDRVSGMVLLNVPYAPPERENKPFDLDAVNALTTGLFGYPCFAYWELFTAPDGPQILRENVSRLYAAIHAAGPEAMRTYLCVPGYIRTYLLASAEEMPEPAGDGLRPYARDPAHRRAFIDRMTRDGFEAPQCWYHATRDDVQRQSALRLSPDHDRVAVPLLYIGATQDAVCRPELMGPAKAAGLLPDLEEHMVEAGHWCPVETPDELAVLMADWMGKKGFVGAAAAAA